MNKIEIINSVKNLELKKNIILINVDLKDINNIKDFIRKVYDGLGCPKDFGLNLNAFFDIIADTEFWVKKPLYLVIRNFDFLYNTNINLRMLISDILIEIIKLKGQKYYVFILQ